jgi:hypothetical protein
MVNAGYLKRDEESASVFLISVLPSIVTAALSKETLGVLPG